MHGLKGESGSVSQDLQVATVYNEVEYHWFV